MGGHSYIPNDFFIFIYILNHIIRNIHNIFSLFFISSSVNSMLYNMLIFIYQQYVIVGSAILFILLEMSSLNLSLIFLRSYFLQSSFFSQSYLPRFIYYYMHLLQFPCRYLFSLVYYFAACLVAFFIPI